MAKQRLDKVLGQTGRWSRKEARELIRRGLVTVDGAVIRQTEYKAEPEQAAITVSGEALTWRQYCYLMLNKPRGYVTTVSDEQGRKTVMDLLTGVSTRVYPVGRLDRDSEGLLLLTNDGALTHRLLSPKSHVDKVYYARTEGTPTEADAARLAQGITLADGLRCLPAELELPPPQAARPSTRTVASKSAMSCLVLFMGSPSFLLI